MYSANNTKNIFMLLLVVVILASFSFFVFLIDQDSPLGHIVAQGGYISNYSINNTVMTSYWAVIYGGFDESSGVISQELYPNNITKVNIFSYGYDSSMVIVANTSYFNQSDIVQVLPSLIDTYLGLGPAHVQSGTNTFSQLYNISIGNITRELYGTQTISLNGSYITAAFSSNGNLAFVTTTENGTAFDNTSTFFQFLLPVNIAQNYSLSVVSNITCPTQFFINGSLANDNVSVHLNWSTIPGTLHSSIYVTDTLNSTNYVEFNDVNSTNTSSNSLIEYVSSDTRYYEVASYLPAYKCTSANMVGMYRVNLTPTANLISFPFSFVNSSVAKVLYPIMDSFNSLNEYNNTAQSYNFYIKFMGSIFSNFDDVAIGKGYWLTVNETVNLTMVGTLQDVLNEEIYNRSNLVGFPFIQGNNSLPYVLRSIDGNYTTVNVYNNTAKSFNFYIIFGGSVFSNFDTINPTLGYWILSNETQTLALP